jgi:hypothetical protein
VSLVQLGLQNLESGYITFPCHSSPIYPLSSALLSLSLTSRSPLWDYKLTNHHSIVSQLACMLDLNTLHDLSRTCRQFRANLFQYRTMLKTLTLCCENESPDPTGTLVEGGQGLTAAQLYSQPKRSGRFTSGKIGPCARDMVGECRKCSMLVCRVR